MKTLRQRLLAGGAWTLGSRVVAGLCGFAVNALLARLLSPGDLGAYFLLVSVVSVGAMAASLGLHIAVVKLIAEALAGGRPGRARGVIRQSVVLVFAGAVLFAIGLMVAGHEGAMTAFGSATLAEAAWIGGAWLACLAMMGLVGEIFRGLHDYRMSGAIGPAGSNLIFLVALVLVLAMAGQANLAAVATLATSAVAAITLAGMVVLSGRARQLGPESGISLKELLIVSLPLLVTSLAIFVSTQADLWILGVFRGKDEVAMYGAAVRLVSLVMMPMLMMNAVLAPVISELFSQGNNARLERVLRASAALTGFPALIALSVLLFAAGPVLEWVYGAYYRGGTTALLLVSLGQTVNVMCGAAATVLMMTGHQRAVMTISAATGLGLICGGLLVVPDYGLNGVATVAAGMTALHGLACLAWVRRSTGMWTHCSVRSFADVTRELRYLLRRPAPEA